MAKHTLMLTFTVQLFLLAATSFLAEADPDGLRETQLSLYLRIFADGANVSVIPVAGIAGRLWTFNQFGTVFVTDSEITEGPDVNSPTVGRLQGTQVTTGLDGLNAQIVLSIVFTNGAYNGSTIQMQGISKQFERLSEVAVVAGTGKFRFARGYATFETYYVQIQTRYATIRFNATIQHY